MWCSEPSCVGCEHNTKQRKNRAEHVVDCQLREEHAPVPLQDRPLQEKQIYQDRLNAAVVRARDALERNDMDAAHGPIDELLTLARQIGRQPLWVYHRLCDSEVSVNVPLLHEIARCENYSSWWTWHIQKQLQKQIERRRKKK